MNNLHPIAQAVQLQGRDEDTQLVHMTPGEVHGLQALAMAHGGSLTINPSTGLPEAGFLKKLLPMAAGLALGPAGFGLMTSLGAGLTVGGLTALTSGDLGKGLMAGLGAWGGSELGGAVAGMGSSAIGGQAASNATAAATAQGKAGIGAYANAARETAIQEATKSQILKEGARAAMSNPMGVVDSLGGFGGAAKVLGAASLPAMLSDQTATKMPDQNQMRTPTTVAQLEYRRNVRKRDPNRGPNDSSEYSYFEGPGYVKTGETTYAAQGGIMGYAQGGSPISGGPRANMSPEEYLNQYFAAVQTATKMPDTNKKAAGGIVSLAEGGSYTPYSAGFKPMTPEEFNRLYMAPPASPAPGSGGGSGYANGNGSFSGYGGSTSQNPTYSATPGTPGQSDIQTDADGRKYRLQYDSATGTYRKIYEEEEAATAAPSAPNNSNASTLPGYADSGGGFDSTPMSDDAFDAQALQGQINLTSLQNFFGLNNTTTPEDPSIQDAIAVNAFDQATINTNTANAIAEAEAVAAAQAAAQAQADAAAAGAVAAAQAQAAQAALASSMGGGGTQGSDAAVAGFDLGATDLGSSLGDNSGGSDGGYGGAAWKSGGLLALAAGGMAKGGFVVPADVVSALGNGSTDAGIRTLQAKLGAIKHIKGKGDGLSDSIPTNIDGKQPARVADGEVYVDPKTVAKIGGGDMKKGASKLYAMMDKVRQQAHGKTSQQRKVSPAKALSA